MANIKFSQFTEKTTLGTVDFLVGYTGAENVQISPTNLLSTFVSGSGTNGQVAYFDPSNNLAGENDFFWDYTNNRLGIGTSSPSYKLEVVGSAGATARFKGSGGQATFSINDGTNDNYIVALSGDLQLRPSGTTVLTTKSSGNVGIGTTSPSAKLEVDGTLVATGISQLGSGGANVYLTSSSAGNVGIGTSSPSQKLAVTGNIGLSGSVLFEDNQGINFGNSNARIYGSSSDGIKFNANGSEAMRLNQSGKVGIGTANPTIWKLNVDSGDIYAASFDTSNNTGVAINGNNTTAAQLLGYSNSASTYNDLDIRANSTPGSGIYIDGSGSHVGVGTTSPTARFEIQHPQQTTQFDRDCFLRLHPSAQTDSGGFTNMFFGTSTTNNYGVAIGGLRAGSTDSPSFSIRMLDDAITGTEVFNISSLGTATFAGNVVVNSSNSTGVNLKVGGESGNGIKTQYIFSGSGQRNWQIGMASHLSQTLSITPSTAGGNTTFTTPILNLDGSDNSSTFAGDVTLSSTAPILYLDNTTSSTGKNWRLSSAANGKMYITQDGVIDAITLDHTTGNATFAGNVTATNILTVAGAATGSPYLQFTQGGTQKAYIQYVDSGDSFELQSDNQFVVRTGGSTAALTINSSQNATFAGRVTIQDTDTESLKINGTSATGSFVRYQTNGTNIGFFGAAYHLIGSSPAGYENDFGIRAESDLRFTIGASEKMSIINNGNVGIGTSSPDNRLDVVVSDVNVTPNSESSAVFRRNGNNYISILSNSNNFGGILFGEETDANDGALSYDHPNGNMIFETRDAERMRITSSGVIQNADINNTTSAALKISNNAGGSNFTYGISIEDDSTNTGLILFSNAAGTSIGNITRSGSSTVYATSSDYRLKEDLQDFAGLDLVSKIPVYDFKWKADESRSYGVMAHELQEVLPQAVTEEKDAEEMQGVDYSKIVPLLVKSIQELKSEIEELKSK